MRLVPYPFAHPAAVVPLAAALGRFCVPSALAIGSMIPDAWYLLPMLTRDDSHTLAGLLGFCLPAGVLAYLAFHLLLKHPLVALLPDGLAARVASFAAPGLPAAPAHAVAVSLLAGALTHLAWDGLTHERWVVNGFQLLQHASTLLGTAYLAAWLWRRLGEAPAAAPALRLSPAARRSTLALLIVVSAGWAGWVAAAEALALPRDADGLRYALRTAGMAALQALALSTIGYATLWRLLR